MNNPELTFLSISLIILTCGSFNKPKPGKTVLI